MSSKEQTKLTQEQQEMVRAAEQRRATSQARRDEARKNRASKGIEVPPGVTFADLSQAQRDAYFAKHENGWKDRYNANKAKRSTQPYQSYDRGDVVNVKI